MYGYILSSLIITSSYILQFTHYSIIHIDYDVMVMSTNDYLIHIAICSHQVYLKLYNSQLQLMTNYVIL